MSRHLRRLVQIASLALAGFVLPAGHSAAAPGDLDPSFTPFGQTGTPFGVDTVVEEVMIAPDGGIVVAATVGEYPARDAGLARLLPNGSPDPSFGDGGSVELKGVAPGVLTEISELSGALILPDGKILVSVSLSGRDLTQPAGVAMARFNPDGSLDPSFGVGGVVRTTVEGVSLRLSDLARGPDGSIIAAGTIFFGPPARAAVFRFLPDGGLDPAFGEDGILGLDDKLITSNEPSIAVQSDGRILVGGRSPHPAPGAVVARVLADGTPDPEFGSAGFSVTPVGTTASAGPLLVAPDGRIVVGVDTDASDFALLRLTADGSLDASFDHDGRVLTHFLGGSGYGLRDVALQPDGKILAVGQRGGDYDDGFPDGYTVLARYQTIGLLDNSFAGDGIATTLGAGNADSTGEALALQPDGRIVVSGNTGSFGSPTGFVARYLVGDGPADADADGIGDEEDRCDLVFSTGGRGCPEFDRDVILKRKRAEDRQLAVRVSSPEQSCKRRVEVLLYSRVPGRDRLVTSVSFGVFSSDRRTVEVGRAGAYYAIVRAAVVESKGICKAGRSSTVEV